MGEMIQDANGGHWELADRGNTWEYNQAGELQVAFSTPVLSRRFTKPGFIDVLTSREDGVWTIHRLSPEQWSGLLAAEAIVSGDE